MRAADLPEPSDGRDAAKRLFGWPGLGPEEQESLADIDAEIADHLAAAAAELAQRGRPEHEAALMSQARFGDVASIRRKCWWIQQGDRIMLRWFGIALLGSLVVAVLTLAAGGWRVQTALAARLEALTEELASIHDSQQQLLTRQPAGAAPEIRGHAYLGDASRPAAGAEIEIWNASEMKRFRRLRTDSEGQFRSQQLPPGDYFVLAPLLVDNAKGPYKVIGSRAINYYLQSQPLYVYAGLEPQGLAFDMQLHFGQLSIEIDKPAATAPDSPKPQLQAILLFGPDNAGPSLPVDPNGPAQNLAWPLLGSTDNGPWWMGPWPGYMMEDASFGGSVAEPLVNCPRLMAGRYKVGVMVQPHFVTRERPHFVEGESVSVTPFRPEFLPQRWSFEHLPPNACISLEIAEGKRTHLRIVIPDEIEATARDFQGRKPDDKEILAWAASRPAKIDVVSDQSLLPLDYAHPKPTK